MRLYANAVPVTNSLTAEALLNLLALTGPGSPYGNLRLGIDPYHRFLWICTHVENVPESDVLNAASSFLTSTQRRSQRASPNRAHGQYDADRKSREL